MVNCIQSKNSALSQNHALYIHWPWCKKKCPYCDFNSHVNTAAPTDAYVNALCSEMAGIAAFATKKPLASIFFGGGTPSLMPPEVVAILVEKAEKLFGFAQDIEITLEANPTSAESDKFSAFVHAGVNRFSIGMQSPDEKDLVFLGREHNADEAFQAIKMAQQTDANVSLDVIYGLPHQDLAKWQKNLRALCALDTSHISAYQLTIEKNTKFYADMRKGLLAPATDTAQADFYHTTNQVLESTGFCQYEVSNYARNGAQCQHNTHIWRYGSYIGIGAGAHGRTRQQDGTLLATRNYKMPEKYINAVQENSHGRYEYETILPNQQASEALLLGLRLSEGLPMSRLEALNNQPWRETLSEDGIELMVTNGFLLREQSNRRSAQHPPLLKPTRQGLAMLEGVLSYIHK